MSRSRTRLSFKLPRADTAVSLVNFRLRSATRQQQAQQAQQQASGTRGVRRDGEIW